VVRPTLNHTAQIEPLTAFADFDFFFNPVQDAKAQVEQALLYDVARSLLLRVREWAGLLVRWWGVMEKSSGQGQGKSKMPECVISHTDCLYIMGTKHAGGIFLWPEISLTESVPRQRQAQEL